MLRKCPHHSKHNVMWWCPCIKEIPDFWKRISRCAWLIGIEASITSLGRISVLQTKEKFGSTRVYYANNKCDMVEEGLCKTWKNNKEITEPNTVPKYIWKAMERQRRLNPDLAHYIYEFSPYRCKCKNDFYCDKYGNVNPIQKLWDKIITKFLVLYGTHSYRWGMLRGGFVMSGRQWGLHFWQRVKRTFRRPF